MATDEFLKFRISSTFDIGSVPVEYEVIILIYIPLLQMIALLKSTWDDFKPDAISVYFEKGVINAFKDHFRESEIHGCFFHSVQNLKKQVTSQGLSKRYRTDADFALKARMISALAFILEDAVTSLRQ